MARRTTAHKGHPLLNPQNGITFRLLPGLVIGALLQRWFSTQAPKVCRECVLQSTSVLRTFGMAFRHSG